MAEPLRVGGAEITPGSRQTVALPLPRLYTRAEVSMPVHVVHGRRAGPRVLLCAALHGDELNGLEIIRRVLQALEPSRLRGTLLAVPVVNVYGLITQTRYLPDRRDLNRCFPGTRDGSLGARVAHTFFNGVVLGCTHGIDLHTAALNRSNLPHIRGDLSDAATRSFARAFDAPVTVHASTRDGSLREAATESGVKMLVYEAGAPLRFDEAAIGIGMRGILRSMAHLGMGVRKPAGTGRCKAGIEVQATKWVRARVSGVLRLNVALGDRVRARQLVGSISDPLGEAMSPVRAVCDGMVIGQTDNPLVHRGDAIVHLGVLDPGRAREGASPRKPRRTSGA